MFLNFDGPLESISICDDRINTNDVFVYLDFSSENLDEILPARTENKWNYNN